MQLSSRKGHLSSALVCVCLGWDVPVKSQRRCCFPSHLASSAAARLRRKSPCSHPGAVLTTHFSCAEGTESISLILSTARSSFWVVNYCLQGSSRSSTTFMPMLLAMFNSSILVYKSFVSSGLSSVKGVSIGCIQNVLNLKVFITGIRPLAIINSNNSYQVCG